LRKTVVFSDIDGTLIDIFTRNYGKSKELVKKLEESSIPVVLCSSKTWAEQDMIRKDLGLEGEPFIIENGGAVIIPDGYFEGDGRTDDDLQHHGVIRVVDGYRVIELGRSSAEIRKGLQHVRRKTGTAFKGVSDLSIEELAKIVGMTHDDAERMSKRQYGETILEIDKTEKVQFEQVLSEEGLQVIHGSRYFDVTAGNDKGKAVRILMDLYRKKLGDDTIFIGIGDSPNDIPMLKLTDVAILVQKHDGTWTEVDNNIIITRVMKVEGIGPAGWEKAFATIIKEAKQTDGA
jgi:mannosyl-3-phosphoglycerate phosphatase